MLRPAAAFAALLAASAGAEASITLTAAMTNAQEPQTPNPVIPTLANGQLRPVSFGTATFVINDAMNAMSFEAVVNNIDFTGTQTADTNDNLTNAHIHAGANFPPANNGVAWGFIGAHPAPEHPRGPRLHELPHRAVPRRRDSGGTDRPGARDRHAAVRRAGSDQRHRPAKESAAHRMIVSPRAEAHLPPAHVPMPQ